MNRAFTLIEVLISVIIIATSMLYVLQLHSRTQNEASYIRHRSIAAFEDSLFLTRETANMRGDKTDAYTLWHRHVSFRHDRTLHILKSVRRTVTSRREPLIADDNEKAAFSLDIVETFLQDTYSGRYYRVDLHHL